MASTNRKGGRGAKKYTKKQMETALRKANGMVYLASQQLGCAYNTMRNWIERYPELQAIVEEESGQVLDAAERRLYEAILRGEPWAIKFALSTKGRDRGYGERKDHRLQVVIREEVDRLAAAHGMDVDEIMEEVNAILGGEDNG